MTTFTIDGKEYDLESLSDETKTLLSSIQFADSEISRLNGQLALAQRARNSYASALAAALGSKSDENLWDTIKFN